MLRRPIVSGVVLLALVGLTSIAQGQTRRSGESAEADKPLLEQIEDFGRNLFGGVFPKAQSDKEGPDQRAAGARPGVRTHTRPAPAGSTYNRPVPQPSPAGTVETVRSDPRSTGQPATIRSPEEETDREPEKPRKAEARSVSETGTPPGMPLYARMNAFRQSVFGDEEAKPSRPARSGDARTPVASGPASSQDTSPVVPTVELPLRPPRDQNPQSRIIRPANVLREPPAEPTTKDESPTKAAAPTAAGSSAAAEPEATGPEAAEPTPAPKAVPKASPVVEEGPAVLAARESPHLSVETAGPQKISVGRQATYEVTIANSGGGAAEELVVLVDLPSWAELTGTDASAGRAEVIVGAQGSRQCQWKVGRLEAKAKERLTLRIKPQESRSFDLAVRWDYRRPSTQAMIEVQEPKLTLGMEGPREVLYGKREVYRLRIANVGNGEAENVIIRLLPLGAGDGVTAQHNFGAIGAGQERSIEVELTARQVGNLTMKVEVQCDGGVRAELKEEVLVRRAGLQVEVAAPKFQYVDAAATYRVRVGNPGSAPAHDIQVIATLPAGAKFVSAAQAGRWNPDNRQVHWSVERLEPGAQKLLELKCTLVQAGRIQIDLQAAAADDLHSTASAATQVEAMADLVMDVVDPAGPVAVGEDATYELRIHNRGTKSAEEVELSVFFSQGIEPVAVEGPPHRISLGQVAFQAIPTIGAGKELRLKVHARAQAAGNHIFRAEVHCRPLGTRLVSEETTHFFAADPASGEVLSAGTQASGAARTADRRSAPVTPGIGPDTRPSSAPGRTGPVHSDAKRRAAAPTMESKPVGPDAPKTGDGKPEAK